MMSLRKRKTNNNNVTEQTAKRSKRLQNGDASSDQSNNSQETDPHNTINILHESRKETERSDSNWDSDLGNDNSQQTVINDSQETEVNSDCDISASQDEINDQPLSNTEDISEQSGGSESVFVPLQKIISIQVDADKISDILGHDDVDAIYNRLKVLRQDKDRVTKVTTAILEADNKGSVAAGSNILARDNQSAGSANVDISITSIINDISCIIKEMKNLSPALNITTDEVYFRLESVIHLPNRVQNVINTLLEDGETKSGSMSQPSEDSEDIFQQVQQVLKQCPHVDANRVYNLLEVFSDDSTRIDKVVQHLRKASAEGNGILLENCKAVNAQSPHAPKLDVKDVEYDAVDGASTSSTRKVLLRGNSYKKDPLYCDMQQLTNIFPDRSEQEIYAHLEVYHNKPNRIQLVTEEFLRAGSSQPESFEARQEESMDVVIMPESSEESQEESDEILQQFKYDVNLLKAVFPDCEHKYLIEQLQEHFKHKTRVDMVTATLLNQKDYPKKDMSVAKVRKKRQTLEKMSLCIESFLKMFPDPISVFSDETTEMSELYKQHAKKQLIVDYAMWKPEYLIAKLKSHNFHYHPTLKDIQSDMVIMAPAMQYHLAGDSGDPEADQRIEWPKAVDEYFYRELLFMRNEDKISKHIKAEKEAIEKRRELARGMDELQECQCCFEEDILPEEMSTCESGHLFCAECIARSVESALTEGKASYPCLTGTCGKSYSLRLLQDLLSTKTFSHVLRRTQEEELRQANISGLVTCPFCPYATVMPDDNDRLLRCLNPDCLKESCRLCHELSHIPLRCDEVEKGDEIKMRTFIENKMAEAMMRTCPACGKKFYKIHGCNKMTCVCGESMCYVCREPITEYNHFENNERCSNDTSMQALHNRETDAAAKEARETYLSEHPELGNIILKHDPTLRPDTSYSESDSEDDSEDDDDHDPDSDSDNALSGFEHDEYDNSFIDDEDDSSCHGCEEGCGHGDVDYENDDDVEDDDVDEDDGES